MSEIRLIDANALKAKIKSKYDYDDAEFDRGYNIGLQASVDLIDNAPTVPNEYMRGYEAAEREYKRPQGEWIEYYDPEDGFSWLTCSRCMTKAYEEGYNYCPQCGARMEAENDSSR